MSQRPCMRSRGRGVTSQDPPAQGPKLPPPRRPTLPPPSTAAAAHNTSSDQTKPIAPSGQFIFYSFTTFYVLKTDLFVQIIKT